MQGQRGLSTNSSEYDAQDFMISQMLGRIATAEPVRVVSVWGSGVRECWRIARDGAPLLVFTDWRQLPSVTGVVQLRIESKRYRQKKPD